MESTEKKSSVLTKIFVVLGVIFAVFLVLIIGGFIALVVMKPYGLDVLAPFKENKAVPYDHPLLSSQQEKTLQNLGIDPAVLPTSITSAQTQCAMTALGQKRANEILAGATPTITEILTLKKCL